MRRKLATALALGGLLAATLGATTSATADEEQPEQWRSYWVDAFNEGIYTPEQADQLVEDALKINANALIVQTVRRYDCFCNDAQYPRTDAGIDPAPYDPLATIIDKAHAAGLEVHAWVNVNTLWNSSTAPTSPDHVFNQHGPNAEGTDRWLNKKADGTEFIGANAYIDPGHPDAVNYIVSGIQSIVENYDVDGINLDYVRYPDFNSSVEHSDWGYNDVSVARFQEATGTTEVPEASDPAWNDWRRDQVTNLVRKIYLGMFEVDPQARLSMDAITYGFGPQSVGGWEGTRTYAEVLQDWRGWLEEGIMDTAVTMNYKRDWSPPQDQMFDEWSEFLADNQADRQAVNGPALYLNDIDSALAQAEQASSPSEAGNTAAGWSGYSYANPSNQFVGGPWEDRSAERDMLAETLTAPGAPFEHEASVPEMTWKTQPTTGNIAGRLTLKGGNGLDQVNVTLYPLMGGEPQSISTDGSGWFGFVDVDPGHYLVQVDLPDRVVGQPVKHVKVKEGGIADASIGKLIKF
jgi:uncharacterized lipoprotein YddW (UPF0748 family)